MKAEDTKYGRNWAGKASLCETCAYTGGYCLKNRMRFYRCKDYVNENYQKDGKQKTNKTFRKEK